MNDRLLVREEALGARRGAHEELDRTRSRPAKVEVPGQQLDAVIARPVHLLRRLGGPAMQLASPSAQETPVCHVTDQRVVEHHDPIRTAPVDSERVEQAGPEQLIEVGCNLLRVPGNALEQRDGNASTDHGRHGQGRLGGRPERIQPNGQDALDGRRHLRGIPFGAQAPRTGFVAVEGPRILEGSHDLLGKERVAGGAFEDHLGQPRRGCVADDVIDQLPDGRGIELPDVDDDRLTGVPRSKPAIRVRGAGS